MFFVTFIWLWSGERISSVQSGAIGKILATPPLFLRGSCSQVNTAMSGTVDRPPKVQRSSEKALRCGLRAAVLIAAANLV
jgi:hypothetical protein